MYKKKKIALVFFARSNSRRLKNKLFKKILNKTILSHAIDLTKNLKIVDEDILLNKEPDYILLLAWHLSKPIIEKWRKKGLKSKFIIPLPEIKII